MHRKLCRSQMAEGWLRHMAGDEFYVASAGTQPVGLNHRTVHVMEEMGIDLSDTVSSISTNSQDNGSIM